MERGQYRQGMTWGSDMARHLEESCVMDILHGGGKLRWKKRLEPD